jgi:predicted MPP superfamily phosphohydrolase
MINDLAPDFACFTGDLIEHTIHLPEALEILRSISRPLYGVPGNHDYWADADWGQIGACFAATGGAWLMDQQTLTRDKRFNIIGLTCAGPPNFALDPKAKNLMLLHYPGWVKKIGGARPDLMLAGHSHGGQVRLPFYGAALLPSGVGDFEMGLYQTENGPLYVNPGLGCFYLNVRLFCRPEITVIEV